MPEPTPAPSFAELVSRHLDGRLSEAEHALLSRSLLEDASLAQEFASMVRFEAILRKNCRRDAKALLEFVAMEAVSAPATPERRTAWKTTLAPWLRAAAVFAVLAALTALWLAQEDTRVPVTSAGSVTPAPLEVQSADPRQVVLLAPRASSPKADPATPLPAAPTVPAPAPKVLTLAERLDDFYLPQVSLRQVRAQDATNWLAAQLRQHNYAKRPDFNSLSIQVPADVAARIVTLESGPISFKKAVEIIAALAESHASITADAILLEDLVALNLPVPNGYQVSPWNEAETKLNAAALGIPLDKTRQNVDADGVVRLRLGEEEQRALHTLAEAQKQLESLTPLSFVPLLLPPGIGEERVLSATEVEVIRDQLATAPAGSLPVVKLPFGSTGQTTPLLDSSGSTALTLKVTPVGEMNQVTIQPTAPVTTPSNLLANATPAPPQPPVDALLSGDQGVTVIFDEATGQLYTSDGIPIPPGYEYLYGYAIAAPATTGATAASLVLVPVP